MTLATSSTILLMFLLTSSAVLAEMTKMGGHRHRDANGDALSNIVNAASDKIYRKLQETGDTNGDTAASPGIFCQWIEAVFGEDFVEGEGTGKCTCDGAIDSSIELTCNLDNVCGEGEEGQKVCGNLDYNVILSGVWVDGWFGETPEMLVTSCLEATSDNFSWLDEWCIEVKYATPDWGPKSCHVTYDGEDCTCDIENASETNPCYTWDCTQAEGVEPPLDQFLKSEECMSVAIEQVGEGALDASANGDIPKSSSNTVSVTSFMPAIAEVPEEVKADLETTNNNPNTVVNNGSSNNDDNESGSRIGYKMHFIVGTIAAVVVVFM